MKKSKMILAIALAMMMVFPAQAAGAETGKLDFGVREAASGYDEQYPLSEYRDWFVVNPVTKFTDWKWDYMYIGAARLAETGDYTPDPKYGGTPNYEYVIRHSIADNDFRYLMCPGTAVEQVVIARLAGAPLSGYSESFINGEEVAMLERETREFLNSFDWRNASDEEKAVRIVKRINQTEYDFSDNPDANKSHLTYGCLVNGTALCDGYVNAAVYLGFCVNIPVSGHGVGNHEYSLFRVNGAWLSNDSTSKDFVFQIYDPAEGYYRAGDMKCFQEVGGYCNRIGYQVPETLDGVIHEMTLSDGTRIFKSLAWYDGRNGDVMQFQ